jgi:ATP-binding protein involved in chromosome partitioning
MSDDKVAAERVLALLGGVKYPGFPRDVVTLGMVAGVDVDDRTVRVRLRVPGGRPPPDGLQAQIASALAPLGRTLELEAVAPAAPETPRAATANDELLPDVRTVLAVSSAKGGVGKSTVATNLACAFAAAGYRTGLLDADVYGPSLPILMGAHDRPSAAGGKRFHPVTRHGVRCISMGFFLDDTSPVIWRGPLVAGLLQQFLGDCVWGPLDVLVVDLPPGTGDAQLTLAQRIRITGALLVTTPQEVALRDVARGLAMFRQVQVPILGIVENMSFFRCPECGEAEALFGQGGGERLAEEAGLPILARIPLETSVREHGDAGEPIVCAGEASEAARVFTALAGRVASSLGLAVAEAPAPRA